MPASSYIQILPFVPANCLRQATKTLAVFSWKTARAVTLALGCTNPAKGTVWLKMTPEMRSNNYVRDIEGSTESRMTSVV